MQRRRSVLALLAIYATIIGTLIAATSFSLIWMIDGSAAFSRAPDREKTVLDQRIESAREVRRALAKRIPPPAPLPPITAKLERPVQTAAAKNPRISTEARDAFASMNTPSYSYNAYDRHAPQ